MQRGYTTTITTPPHLALTERPLVTRRQALGLALVAGAGGLLLAACGGSTTATSVPQAVATIAPAPTVVATAATGARATTTAAAATQKVNANTASEAEILAAFQAAGIPSAAQWVKEVVEYRPYPTDDPTFAKLRTALAKYNPAPGVVDRIIAVLSLT